MEDFSSYEKVKHEKRRKYYVYAFWSVCIYIYIYIYYYISIAMCNLCIELSIFFY